MLAVCVIAAAGSVAVNTMFNARSALSTTSQDSLHIFQKSRTLHSLVSHGDMNLKSTIHYDAHHNFDRPDF